jgi:hypothetical protein
VDLINLKRLYIGNNPLDMRAEAILIQLEKNGVKVYR